MKQFLTELIDLGLVPYVATSGALLDSLDLSLFEGQAVVKLLERPEDRNFHEAYLVSNSLGFGNPDLKMPNWVYIDCVLMQTAVVGFAIPVSKAPESLLNLYERDPYVDVDTLDYIPVSGQISALGLDGNLTGFSLFSLRKQLAGLSIPPLGNPTKYAALSAYKAEGKAKFSGLTQYDNRALKTHALFGPRIYIEQPIAPLHPMRDMSFIYAHEVLLDEKRIFGETTPEPTTPDFLMRADDLEKKLEMQDRIKSGERFYIADPIQIKKEDGIVLPICVERVTS